LRYNEDERHIDLVRSVSSPAGTAVATQNESRRWRALTPELTVDYVPRQNRLYYLTASRGYKPGGFNTSAIQPAFDPEFLLAYEAGLKATLPARRLRVDAALFYYDYRNMQFDTPPSNAPVGTFPIVINAAKSALRGLDVRLLARPGRGATTLSLGATLLDAHFSDFVSVDPNRPDDDPNRDGNRMPQAPGVSLNLGVQHSRHVRHGRLAFSVGYRYQSAMYFDIYADPALRQSGYALLDAAVEFEGGAGHWDAQLYGRNLTDTLYAETILRRDPLTGTKRFWGAPRTIGLRLGYRW
jgi:iron complex outermembrane receptor protein